FVGSSGALLFHRANIGIRLATREIVVDSNGLVGLAEDDQPAGLAKERLAANSRRAERRDEAVCFFVGGFEALLFGLEVRNAVVLGLGFLGFGRFNLLGLLGQKICRGDVVDALKCGGCLGGLGRAIGRQYPAPG